MRNGIACRAAAGCVAVAASAGIVRADIHWWVGGLFNWWDSDTLWASGPVSPGGLGVPQTGDVARADIRQPGTVKTILYRNTAGITTNLLQVDISGEGTGASDFIHFVMSQDVLKAGTMTFGRKGNTT
ncbi:MAG: hypothetical protein KDA21_12035, partial [Phycisphaerales bacterium]|nr:hypothetical protein [Phycisphaerales bacterium]